VSKIITLTTDFGMTDAYVPTMKGVILGINPDVRLVDISHGISPQEIMEAAYVLRSAYYHFPPGTVHVAVVDPGVGTQRDAIAVRLGEHYFVGPDNGLFPLCFSGEPADEMVRLDRRSYWRTPHPSPTFHGRDIFAPVAAHMTAGRTLEEVGSPLDRLVPLHWPLPIADEQGIQGWVVHVDHYGNCITNIPRDLLEERGPQRLIKCFVGSSIIDSISTTYSDVEDGEPLLLINSNQHLEIAVHGGNAAGLLSIRKGTPVNILYRNSQDLYGG